MRTIATLKAGRVIASGEDFKNNGGSFEGKRLGPLGAAYIPMGRLRGTFAAYLRGRGGKVTYLVTSYGTPIAWYDVEDGWTIPPNKYSATTSRHQGVVRSAIGASA